MSRFKLEAIFTAIDNMTPAVNGMGRNIQRFANNSTRSLEGVGRAFSRVGSGMSGFGRTVGVGIVATATTVGYGVKRIMDSFSMFEDAEASFSVLLGGADKAKIAVKELGQMAAKTPFRFSQLANEMKILLNVFDDAPSAMEQLRMLGDLSLGDPQSLESITRGYTKAVAVGKADAESMRMIGERGVRIFQELAKQKGLASIQDLFSAMRKGTVDVKDLNAAVKSMTSYGGKYYRGMELRAMTFSGRVSTLLDLLELNMANIGAVLNTELSPLLNDAIDYLRKLYDEFDMNKEGYIKDFKEAMEDVRKIATFLKDHWKSIAKAVVYYVALAKTMSIVGGMITMWSQLVVIATSLGVGVLPLIGIVAGIVAGVGLLIYFWEDLGNILDGINPYVKIIGVSMLLLMGPIGIVTAAVLILADHWESIVGFIKAIPEAVSVAFDWVMVQVDKLSKWIDEISDKWNKMNRLTNFINTVQHPIDTLVSAKINSGDDSAAQFSKASMSGKIDKSIQESVTKNKVHIVIDDKNGNATVKESKLDSNVSLQMSGAY